jgi:hypothetical protein
MSLDDYAIKNKALNKELSLLSGMGLNTYQVGNIFCKNQCRLMSDAGKPIYFDGGHLTLTGSELLRGLFYNIVTEAIAAKPPIMPIPISSR